MKHPKHEPTLMEILKLGTEELVDCIDLDEIRIPAKLVRKIQKLNRSGDIEAAKDLYESSVLIGVSAAEEEQFLAEWARRKGGVNRGLQKTEEASQIRKWLYPLLAECDQEIPPKSKQRGWRTMQRAARIKITSGKLHYSLKSLITRARVQAWIDEGRPGK